MIDYDRIAAEYARSRRIHPQVLRDLVSTGGIGPSSTVLEVGCGTGNYIVEISRLTGCSGHGLDPSEEMLARVGTRSSPACI